MSDASVVSLKPKHRGLILWTIASYAFAVYFAFDIRSLNPNGVLQQGASGEAIRLPAFAYGFNAIMITLFFVGVAFTVAGLLLATSFAHYPMSHKARAFAKASAIYAGIMAIGMIVGQLAQRGYL